MRTVSVEEFRAELKAQGVSSRDHVALVCPICGCAQTAADLIEAGAGATFDEVERFLGFSCVGRWTNAGPARRPNDGKPCDWTLGGLFRLHTLEVITADGDTHPRFEPASPAVAQALEAGRKAVAA